LTDFRFVAFLKLCVTF